MNCERCVYAWKLKCDGIKARMTNYLCGAVYYLGMTVLVTLESECQFDGIREEKLCRQLGITPEQLAEIRGKKL